MTELAGGPIEIHCPKILYRELVARFPHHLELVGLEEGELLTEHLCERARQGPLCEAGCRTMVPDEFRGTLITLAIRQGAFELAARQHARMDDPEGLALMHQISLELSRNDRSLLPYLEDVARQGFAAFDELGGGHLTDLFQGLRPLYPHLALLVGLSALERCEGLLADLFRMELKDLAQDLDVPPQFQRTRRPRRSA